MNKTIKTIPYISTMIASAALLVTSCNFQSPENIYSPSAPDKPGSASNPALTPTPLPTRTTFKPGELVDYLAQTGDTLPALALRFNTTVAEILSANPQIPHDATTMPPGMPMKIPIYYRALWASPFQIIPDHAFVNGPTSSGFNTAAFIEGHPGWLKGYRVYTSGKWRSGAEMVDYIAVNYSISPHLLLAVLEYQGEALSNPKQPSNKNLLGFSRRFWETPYLQLVLAANTLNNGYYGWRSGALIEFEDLNQKLIRPDPWQNAASVAIQYYFSRIFSGDDYAHAIGPGGLFQTYLDLFGNPWEDSFTLIPGSLQQPDFMLPFQYDQVWSYTGGPHTGWGTGEPLAAIDLAPPLEKSGCYPAKEETFATAMADGLVVRSSPEGVVLDLDKDGNERTGWVIFYLHLAAMQRAPLGTELKAGDKIGYPSCEGGRSTGTHVHVARKYNGEWIPADSVIPLTMNGWVTHNGSRAYLGTLQKGSAIVRACDCGDAYTAIKASDP
ncbi:MAG: LysM peptidoglycan-binding domain-containing protein [Anaerolineaceae bacterium]|nr:MAG: LysM peptidoglycan-binding domain-containing protein [Anaerolineaceae bacterium]